MNTPENIAYGIKAVKEVEYFVDESVDAGENPDLHFNANIRSIVAEDEVYMTVSASYLLKGMVQGFLREKVTTVFTIKDLKIHSAIIEGKEVVNLPDPLWINMFSISFTHVRALLAKNAAGTKYNKLILPIINPDDMFRKIFAKELEKKEEGGI